MLGSARVYETLLDPTFSRRLVWYPPWTLVSEQGQTHPRGRWEPQSTRRGIEDDSDQGPGGSPVRDAAMNWSGGQHGTGGGGGGDEASEPHRRTAAGRGVLGSLVCKAFRASFDPTGWLQASHKAIYLTETPWTDWAASCSGSKGNGSK